jgi:hypothetical protein
VEFKKSRRRFLKYCSQLGLAGLSLFLGYKKILARIGDEQKTTPAPAIDLKARSYCGIDCENECELLKATRENDIELKKKVYHDWKWKETFGVAFDPDQVFCYTCKPANGKLKIGMAECEVRKCALANGMESCIQCRNLTQCDKEFWKGWSSFYNHVKELQVQYIKQTNAGLLDIKKNSE